jgi:serine/threonine protein kinase
MEECLQDRLNGSPFITEHYCTFVSETQKPGLAVLVLQLIEDAVDLWDFVYSMKGNDAVGALAHHFQYDEATVARIAAQIISATWFMHQMQVVYRDMKVENILLRPNGDIMLLDFGLSSDPAKPCHRSSNRLLGTPYYIAPEYFKPGRPRYVAVEADWYALGIVMYELAFRDGPFPQIPSIRVQDLAEYIAKGFKCIANEPRWDSLCDLVNQLCDPDPKLRLGNLPGSYDTFRNHPFLANTEISALLNDAEILVQMKKFVAAEFS